jgi:hypothetical protein
MAVRASFLALERLFHDRAENSFTPCEREAHDGGGRRVPTTTIIEAENLLKALR